MPVLNRRLDVARGALGRMPRETAAVARRSRLARAIRCSQLERPLHSSLAIQWTAPRMTYRPEIGHSTGGDATADSG